MDHNLLVSELQALVAESRRRHADVKDGIADEQAGEEALGLLRNGQLSRDQLIAHADKLLAPITLGCRTKVVKIVGISIAALQRLVSLGGVPTSRLPDVLQTLNTVANQAVDIQLRLLQTLLSVLTHNSDVHGEVLGSESRVSVVSSTAAATLRQAVMLVFDRIASPSSNGTTETESITLPTDPPTEVALSPSARDAYYLLSDLCLLTASAGSGGGLGLWGGEKAKPTLLKLSGLQKTFGLELVESILSGYEEGVKQHSLTPLLLKQAEKPSFPIALRVCRLIFLLVRSFSEQLPAEVETFFLLLLRVGAGDVEAGEEHKKDVPPYMRVLALECLRGISGDAHLLQTLYERYDARTGAGGGGTKLFQRLVGALSKLLNERPALLGASDQMRGLGVPADQGNASGYFDVGLGIVSAAASVGVHTVSSMMGSESAGLGAQSGMKQRLIEQHDKADAPPVTETYPYLLAVQALAAIAEGIYAAAQSQAKVDTARSMANAAWPALLAAIALLLATNLSDLIFAEVLSAFHDFTVACGLLELHAPRDAFLATLGKYAVPPPAVAAMQAFNDSGPSGRSVSATGADALGLGALGGGMTGPPSLSERNMACLKSVVSIARTLSSSLGSAWHDVLEVLQNANFMLARRSGPARRPTIATPSMSMTSTPSLGPRISIDGAAEKPDVFHDLDADAIQANINVLFDGTREMSDEAFSTFISALCRLSSEMIGIEPQGTAGSSVMLARGSSDTGLPTSPRSPASFFSPGDSRRRTSGIQISASIKSGERSFSLGKLRQVVTLNLARIVHAKSAGGWDAVTQHLLDVARHLTAPSTIRMQACETLDEVLLAAMRVARETRVQHQVFDVLVRQVDVAPVSQTVSTDYDVRCAGYETLNQILESSGHSLEVGWKTIFGVLNWVCKGSGGMGQSKAISRSESQVSIASLSQRPSGFSKGNANLVRIAFPSLNIICTDFLSSLDAEAMRLCIGSLGHFGRQKEDVNIALSSIGLLWNVSDAVQGTTRDSALWLCLLLELLDLARDTRLEVRTGSMQTLFRCIELYGSRLDAAMWRDVLDRVVFPLIDAAEGDEAHVLALSSVGSIFASFLAPIAALDGFGTVWERLMVIFRDSFVSAPPPCRSAALKALERVVQAAVDAKSGDLGVVWTAFLSMGEGLTTAPTLGIEAYTQENLVALVRVAALLHKHLQWDASTPADFSRILRSTMTYARSPEYRPDVDSMSPLQQAIAELVAGSERLYSLSDLAAFVSLAYGEVGPGSHSYVALSKYTMRRLADVFARVAKRGELRARYADGTVREVLAAYAMPIRLKYACPAASKFGKDRPLWQTALVGCVGVIELVMRDLAREMQGEQGRDVWEVVMDVLEGVLLADPPKEGTVGVSVDLEEDEAFVLPLLDRLRNAVVPCLGEEGVPERVRMRFAEALQRASVLYRFDARGVQLGGQDGHSNGHAWRGGTTAVEVALEGERVRYWALELLVRCSCAGGHGRSSKSRPSGGDDADVADEARGGVAGVDAVARACGPVLQKRFEGVLRDFLVDREIRGSMPLPRVREEELMFALRHLVTLRVAPAIIQECAQSDRAHLLPLYPLLLRLAFVPHAPSMWLFPSEHRSLFDDEEGDGDEGGDGGVSAAAANGVGDGDIQQHQHQDAGDGGDLIEVSAKDLARRALEIIGDVLGLGTGAPGL